MSLRKALLGAISGSNDEDSDGDEPRDPPTFDPDHADPDDIEDSDRRYDADWGEDIVRVVVGFESREALDAARMECLKDEWYFRSSALECTLPESAIERLEDHPDIRYVDERSQGEPDAYSWGAERIMADLAHLDGVTGGTVDLGIVDSGANSTHPALQANIASGWVAPDTDACSETCPDFTVSCDQTWDDDRGHGTKMASVAGAVASSAADEYTGTAPDASLHILRVGSCLSGYVDTATAQGIERAADQGYDVINISLSWSESNPSVIEDACQYAYDAGVLMVCSAGNDYGESVNPPAAYNTTMAVSATTQDDILANFSNEGSRIDIASPGVDIEAAEPSTANGWTTTSGTSPAAAIVSGVAALTQGEDFTLTHDQIYNRIQNTAEDIGLPPEQQGAGLVDAVDASGATFVNVATLAATNVDDVSATLNGDVIEVQGRMSIEVMFEWRRVNDTEWIEAGREIWDATEGDGLQKEFSADIGGLDREEDYEYRARVWTSENNYYGDIATFTTLKGFGWPNDLNARSLVTDANGEGTFVDLPHGTWEVEAATNEFEVYSEIRDHQDAGSWTLWMDPRDTDFERSLPDVPAFFEVCALSSRAGDDWQIEVLVSNTGTNPGTDIVTIETAGGETVARHHVDLNGLEHTRISMPVRSALEGLNNIDVTLSSSDDEEQVRIHATGHVPEVLGPGQPRTAGGARAGTVGGAAPTTTGRERDLTPVDDRDIARVPGAWAITLENQAGRRHHLTDVIANSDSFDPAHTEISKWSFDVPADPELDEWDYQTRAYITSDETLVAVGWVNSIKTDKGSQMATIQGRGPEHEIHAGPLTGSVEWSHSGTILKYRAIERAAQELVPEWDISVVRPREPIMLEDPEVSGSPWQCLVELCEPGFRLSVDQQQFRTATIFPPGGVVRDKDWDPAKGDLSRETSRGSYFPAAEVQSPHLDETVSYTDWDAVERLADEQNITQREARQVYPISDDSIETEIEALAEAQGKVRELTDENTIGGEIKTWAEFLPPGAAYPMPWDDDHRLGVHALRFDSGGGVDLPGRAMRALRNRGTVTMWVKAPWSDLSNDEARLIAGSPLETQGRRGIATVSSDTLSTIAWVRGETDNARVRAFPNTYPPDGEWFLWYLQWKRGGGETDIRTGHVLEDGTHDFEAAAIEGQIATPQSADDTLTLGRSGPDHFRGTMDTVSFWSEWLDDSELETLGAEGTLPATRLESRWPMDEGPIDEGTESDETLVYDEFGGYHGRRNEYTRPSGNPQTLRSQSIDGVTMTAQFSRSQTYKEALKRLIRNQS